MCEVCVCGGGVCVEGGMCIVILLCVCVECIVFSIVKGDCFEGRCFVFVAFLPHFCFKLLAFFSVLL